MFTFTLKDADIQFQQVFPATSAESEVLDGSYSRNVQGLNNIFK